MNRKQRRELKKQAGKEAAEKTSQKIFQFDQLPDECLACLRPFDKKSKEMAKTWNVVVPDPDTVRLYCPECWAMARKIAAEYKKEKESD